MNNQLHLICFPYRGPRPQGYYPSAKQMQDSGDRDEGTRNTCSIDVLFPSCFPNERKAPIWGLECDKEQKYSLTFPSETGVESVSRQHLNTCQNSESVTSKVGFLYGDHTIKQCWGDLSILSKGTPDVSCWAWGHLGNGRTGLPPLAARNPLSDDESSNHREQIFSGSQKSDTWKRKADKHTLRLNWPRQGWDKSRAQLLPLWK